MPSTPILLAHGPGCRVPCVGVARIVDSIWTPSDVENRSVRYLCRHRSDPIATAGRSTTNDNLVICNVGPVSFELPAKMANSVAVDRGIGGVFLRFYEDDRSLFLQLPKRYRGALLQHEIDAFPEKSKMTFPRLLKEIDDGQSADFSFGMSHEELRWHKWVLTTRSQMSSDIDLVEYLWRPDLDGHLTSLYSYSAHTFQWATTDRQWEGAMYFRCSSRDDMDWIRHVCTTFVIQGDPSVFDNRDNASIESMITFTPLAGRGRTKR